MSRPPHPLDSTQSEALPSATALTDTDTSTRAGARANLSGQLLSHYRVGAPLGQGGMGVVYRAVDEKLGRPVAIKLLIADRSADAQARARFLREARAASTLDHPNIGTVYEIGEADGAPFIVMALYEGENLRARLARGTPPIAEVVAIARQLCAALAAAHQAGIVHRDLKPANVMILPDGQVKLLDFGLAKLTSSDESSLTREGAILGTLAYMAPEQLRASSEVDARADLWALGALVYEMLTGRPPFGSGPAANVIGRILSEEPAPLPPSAPHYLAAIALRLLCKDPGDRLASALEVGDRLAHEEAPPLPPSRAQRRQLYISLGVISTVVVLITTLVAAFVNAPPAPPSEAELARQRSTYEQGMMAFDRRQFDEAARQFEQSYQASGDATVLYNIAQAYRLGGHPDKAGSYYRKFLSTLPLDADKATPEQRALIAQFEGLLAARPTDGGQPR